MILELELVRGKWCVLRAGLRCGLNMESRLIMNPTRCLEPALQLSTEATNYGKLQSERAANYPIKARLKTSGLILNLHD